MIVYKISNTINNKIYIGQTIRNPQERFQEHIYNALTRKIVSPLYNAIRKYGKESFKFEIIKGVNSTSELNYQEWLAIELNKSLHPLGYNLVPGGNNKGFSRQARCNIGKKTKERMTPEMKSRISQSLKGRKYEEARAIRQREIVNNNFNKPMKIENVETGDVFILKSRKECSLFGINHKLVSEVLSGKRRYKPINGFWVYEIYENRRREESPKRRYNKK